MPGSTFANSAAARPAVPSAHRPVLNSPATKIDIYRGRLAAGDADRLWAPVP